MVGRMELWVGEINWNFGRISIIYSLKKIIIFFFLVWDLILNILLK